jgi:tRNA-dihydrouridine synthase C
MPAEVPLSAKMRLGYLDDDQAEDCARAIADGGASELVVHARTKAHGYRPPAYWERIADIRATVSIKVVANGEIWSVEDARRCMAISGCEDVMLGRGIVANPGLALALLAEGQAAAAEGVTWLTLQPLLQLFWALICTHIAPRARTGRMKQWLNYLRRTYPPAQEAFMQIRTLTDSRDVHALIQHWGQLEGSGAIDFDQSTLTISED